MKVTVSELTASQYARELSAPGVAVIVRQGRQVLSSTIPGSVPAALLDTKNVTINGDGVPRRAAIIPGFQRRAREGHYSVRAVGHECHPGG